MTAEHEDARLAEAPLELAGDHHADELRLDGIPFEPSKHPKLPRVHEDARPAEPPLDRELRPDNTPFELSKRARPPGVHERLASAPLDVAGDHHADELRLDGTSFEMSKHATPVALGVLDETDLDWIVAVVDVVERAQGKPWRVALDVIEGMPISRRRLTAVRVALARLTGGRGKLAQIARKVRTLVLGPPALDPVSRTARIAAAAAQLGVDEPEIESLLFADLRGESMIALPHGRPNELEVAAYANISLIQRALRRAHRVKIWLWDDDGTLLRAATSRGLLVTASARPDGSTLVDIVGPLALFQRTAVYGTTLAQLVPMLSSSSHYVVELDSPSSRARLASPVLLPLAPIDRRATYQPLKLARALERLDPELRVIVGPPPLRSNAVILCPSLALEYRGVCWYLELVGFWTAEHIERKLAAYAAAGTTRVFLCVDAERGCSAEPFELARQPIGHVVQYTRKIDPRAIYQALTR